MPLHRNQSYLRNGLKFGRVKGREDTVSTRVITRSAKSFRSSMRHTGKKGMGTLVLSAMYISSGERGRAPTSIDAAHRRRVGVHCPPRAVAINARTPKGRARVSHLALVYGPLLYRTKSPGSNSPIQNVTHTRACVLYKEDLGSLFL